MSVACQISDNLRESRLEADELARLRRCGEALGITQLGVALVKAGGPGSDGEKMLGARAAPSPQSWFQAASSGKHVTACLILDLASAGRLDLSDPIGSHLADLPGSWASRTIASLLHHTSGLPEYLSHLGASPPPADRAAFMQLAAQLSPIAQEGECWSYSNSNYILLGFLAEELCSRSTAEQIDALFAREQVSGAKTATPDWVRAANAGLVDRAAADADSRMRQVIGDGDVAFTAEGAMQWLHQLLSGTAIPGGTGAELFRPARGAGRSLPYGCGWFLDHLGDDPIAHHAGHFDGWTAMAYLNPVARCGVIAMADHAPGHTRAIRSIALDALEAFAPGSTPLGQLPVADSHPDLTAMARSQLIRGDGEVDRECFAPELQLVIDRAGPTRGGIINFGGGEPPLDFVLVQDRREEGGRMRRYRAVWADRIEHISVGTTDENRIYWAWPL